MRNYVSIKEVTASMRELAEHPAGHFVPVYPHTLHIWADLIDKKTSDLVKALQPFANYACDPPCGCHNCIAREQVIRATAAIAKAKG